MPKYTVMLKGATHAQRMQALALVASHDAFGAVGIESVSITSTQVSITLNRSSAPTVDEKAHLEMN